MNAEDSTGQSGTGDSATNATPEAKRKWPFSLTEGIMIALLSFGVAMVTALTGFIVSRGEIEINQAEVAIAADQQNLSEERFQEEKRASSEQAIQTRAGLRAELLERLVPLHVGTDEEKRLEASALLYLVLPDEAQAMLDIVKVIVKAEGKESALDLSELSDLLEGSSAVQLEEIPDPTAWAIVVGSEKEGDRAAELADAVSAEGYVPVSLFQQGDDLVVVISGFANEGSAREALLAVRSTLQAGAAVVDLDAWCPYATVLVGDLVFCAATSYDQAVLADSPIVYWPLATDLAVDTRDIVSSYDLSPVTVDGGGFTPSFIDGPHGIGAMGFDGSAQQRLESTFDPSQVLGDKSWTIELWMKLDIPSEQQTETVTAIGGWDAENSRRWYTNSLFEQGTVCVGVGSRRVCTMEPALGDGEWRHIASTYDAVTSTLLIYVDGEERQSGNTRGSQAEDEQLFAGPVSIGSMFDSGRGTWGEFWNGGLTRIAVYDTVLRAEQIQSHYEFTPEDGVDGENQ